MNRKWVPLLIAGGVLVPFFVLVVLAYRFSEPETPSPSGRGSGRGVAEIAAAPDAGTHDNSFVSTAAATPNTPLPDPLPKGEGNTVPLQAVNKEARRCLSDASPLRPITIEVHFTPTRDGGFTGVSSNAQDPMIAACLEDVFEELSFDPQRTTDFVPTTHTFRFEPGSP